MLVRVVIFPKLHSENLFRIQLKQSCHVSLFGYYEVGPSCMRKNDQLDSTSCVVLGNFDLKEDSRELSVTVPQSSIGVFCSSEVAMIFRCHLECFMGCGCCYQLGSDVKIGIK